MTEPRFKIVGRQPVPVLPNETIPAGVEVLNVDETLRRVKYRRQDLLSLWDAFCPAADDPLSTISDDDAVGGKRRDEAQATVAVAVERAVTAWRDDSDKVLIRNADFGRIGDADLALFLARCARRKLDPWRREVYPKFAYNDARRRMDLFLIVAFETMVTIAVRSGAYHGWEETRYEYNAAGKVVSAHVILLQRAPDGSIVRFPGDAFMEEYYPGEGVDRLWDTMPRMNLKRCARADALRMANPQLNEVYLAVELARAGGSSDPTAAGGPRGVEDQPSPADDAGQVDPAEDVPETPRAFQLALVELGVKKPERRTAIDVEFRTRFPGLADRSPREFYRRVLAAVRGEPQRWTTA